LRIKRMKMKHLKKLLIKQKLKIVTKVVNYWIVSTAVVRRPYKA